MPRATMSPTSDNASAIKANATHAMNRCGFLFMFLLPLRVNDAMTLLPSRARWKCFESGEQGALPLVLRLQRLDDEFIDGLPGDDQ